MSKYRPQDDLYRYLNADWLTTHEIPADRASDGIFYELRDRSEEACKEIIEADIPAGPGRGLLASLYSSFMDAEAIEERGLQDLVADFARIDKAVDEGELAEVLASLEAEGCGSWLDLYVYQDPNDAQRYRLWLEQGGLGLPDEAYYHAEEYAPIRRQYLVFLERLIEAAELDISAAEVMELETSFAAEHWDNVRARDAQARNNPRTLKQLQAEAPDWDWLRYFTALGFDTQLLDQIIVAMPDTIAAQAQIFTSAAPRIQREWIKIQLIGTFSSVLPERFVQIYFDFYSTVLAGITEMKPRWKRGVAQVEHNLGELLGQAYVDKYFPPSTREAANELVDALLDAYRDSIASLEWMGPETRRAAQEKLDRFLPKIGYPSRWKNLPIDFAKEAPIIEKIRACIGAEMADAVAKLGREADRSEWLMTPQTVNAYYNPAANEIVFPAAILQPPFFDPERSDAENFGAIGAVIGHEIGHGFDDQGSHYDGDGNLNEWWSASDRAEFERRTRGLIEQYNAYSPEGTDAHVNGELTIGENIGDLGGLEVAYLAWQKRCAAKATPNPGDARQFFESWAYTWRTKVRPQMAEQLLAIDPHSPAEFRCNGVVRNIDAFHETYGTQPGDALYLEESERIKIW
ncbi:MAG: M13 family metallopeptidase [Varibaculum sp.]|nr:M13 family metallopeptidase [Varibaculum sp.]